MLHDFAGEFPVPTLCLIQIWMAINLREVDRLTFSHSVMRLVFFSKEGSNEGGVAVSWHVWRALVGGLRGFGTVTSRWGSYWSLRPAQAI
jgi:hypothetical protein